MATYRPIVYLSGFLTEMPDGNGVPVVMRGVASPGLDDINEGEMIIDTDNNDLVLKLNNKLYRYKASDGIQTYNGQWDFSDPRFSHWIGTGVI